MCIILKTNNYWSIFIFLSNFIADKYNSHISLLPSLFLFLFFFFFPLHVSAYYLVVLLKTWRLPNWAKGRGECQLNSESRLIHSVNSWAINVYCILKIQSLLKICSGLSSYNLCNCVYKTGKSLFCSLPLASFQVSHCGQERNKDR